MRPWESSPEQMEAQPAASSRPSVTSPSAPSDHGHGDHGERQHGHQHRERHRTSTPGSPPPPRPRVANACDVCKRRKVKCDGQKPCSYCLSRKLPGLCTYSPPKQRRARVSRLSGLGVGEAEGEVREGHKISRARGDGSEAMEGVVVSGGGGGGGGREGRSTAALSELSRVAAGVQRASVSSSHARSLSGSSRKGTPAVAKESQTLTTSRRRSLHDASTHGSSGGGGGGGGGHSRSGQSRSRSPSRPASQSQSGSHSDVQQQEQGQEDPPQTSSSPPHQRSPQNSQPNPNLESNSNSAAAPGQPQESHGNEETEVPREGRLLVDPQGKLIFIGDSAPLSFFRTVQRLITSRIDADAFAPENSGYSALENTHPGCQTRAGGAAGGVFPGVEGGFGGGYGGGRSFGGGYGPGPPPVNIEMIEEAVTAYFQATAGLIDIFDDRAQQPRHLVEDLAAWAVQLRRSRTGINQDGMFMGAAGGGATGGDASSAVYYLVLAIGLLFQKPKITATKSSSSPGVSSPSSAPPPASSDSDFEVESTAQLYFDHARDLAFANLTGNLGLASVQSFLLITLYMLGACQINGAFIFFGIAARSAFSIGIHRTEVNARFSPEIHRQRDRLWKSLRVVDLFLSTSMGRPPATSDVDCTVLYHAVDGEGREETDLGLHLEGGSGNGGRGGRDDYLLNGSAQIFLIIEGIVLEVYSRRKISPQLTEGISRELREWSARWLHRLKRVIEERPPVPPRLSPTQQASSVAMVNGACQVLASYYYAVILVSRPFLMVELRRRLAEGYPAEAFTARDGLVTSGKSKLADACIDAASLMVDPIQDLIQRGLMTRRAPLIVSWLFASSLVLGLGLLGGFGRIIEKYCRASIAALEYFAEADAHAVQYSLIAKSLLNTALAYLEKREMQDRLRRTESSSQLFGLIPRGDSGEDTTHEDNTHDKTNDHGDLASNDHQTTQHDQQSHYQRSIQHTNPLVGGHFAGGLHGGIRTGGSTHAQQQQQQQPKPSSSYPMGTHQNHNSQHIHHHHHHSLHTNHHYQQHHAHYGHTPPSSFAGDRFNMNHFDFASHGHESTATTFLGMTESLPRTPEFSIMGGSLDSDADQTFGALSLFPLLETDGHIDLANYF